MHDIEPYYNWRHLYTAEEDEKSPFLLYTQAEIHLQWAFCKIKFGEYVSAAFEVKKAYSLLLNNQKKFPDFKYWFAPYYIWCYPRQI